MSYETRLISYLPPFLAEYREIAEALVAEDEEFELARRWADRVLYNEFIETADEDGIERFEALLGIAPMSEDSLEIRRARLRSRWLRSLPCTIRMLIKKLTVLCGDDFKVTVRPYEYTISVITHLRLYSEITALNELLEEMIPANMAIESFNSVHFTADGAAAVYTGLRISGKHRKIRVEVKNYGLE